MKYEGAFKKIYTSKSKYTKNHLNKSFKYTKKISN